MKKSTKVPRMEDQTAPPPRVDPDEESKDRYQKLFSPIQTTPPSAATREKHTKKLKNLVKQLRHGYYIGNNTTYNEQHTGTIQEHKERKWSQWRNMLQY